MPARHLILVGLAGAVLACGSDSARSLAATRDSSGIRIVENPSPEATTAVIRLSDMPELVLGSLDGPEEEQFGSIVGVQRLASGHVVVADRRNYELRMFDSAGRFIRRIGRSGEGPGDFSRLAALVGGEGGIHTWDFALRRLSTFSTGGDFVRDRRLADPPPRDSTPVRVIVLPLQVLADGRAISTSPRPRFNPATGNYRDSSDIWLADSAGALVRVGTAFTLAHYFYNTPDGSTTSGMTPFGPQGKVLPTGAGWIQSDGEQFELRHLTLDNTLTMITRVQRSPRRVNDADRQWFMDSLLADYPPEFQAGERNAVEWAEWSSTMPAYDAILQDSEGLVWARLYPYDAATANWDVFDGDGRLVATASTPRSLEVKQIGPDWLLGQTKGETYEPLVLLYRLTR